MFYAVTHIVAIYVYIFTIIIKATLFVLQHYCDLLTQAHRTGFFIFSIRDCSGDFPPESYNTRPFFGWCSSRVKKHTSKIFYILLKNFFLNSSEFCSFQYFMNRSVFPLKGLIHKYIFVFTNMFLKTF